MLFRSGQFVYRYVMASSISYNASLGYRFSGTTSWLRGTRVRLGVTNLTNQAPPLATGGFGYSPGVSQNLLAGRAWFFEATRSF